MRPDNGKSKPFMNKTKKNNNNYENGYKWDCHVGGFNAVSTDQQGLYIRQETNMKHSLGSPGTDFHRTVDPQLMIRSWKAYDLVHLKSKRIQLVTMRMVHNSFEKYSKPERHEIVHLVQNGSRSSQIMIIPNALGSIDMYRPLWSSTNRLFEHCSLGNLRNSKANHPMTERLLPDSQIINHSCVRWKVYMPTR
jgi:hypothetical protein